MYATLTNLIDNDWYAVAFSATLIIGYHVFLSLRLKADPLYTIQAATAAARVAWVESIMSTSGRDVLAVQTLRNSMMTATFLASTAVLLIIGTLTLSGEAERLRENWHALNIVGATHAQAWLTKVLILLVDFVMAFFSFAMTMRLLHLVGYMINIPAENGPRSISPPLVAKYLNRAGAFYAFGMRMYYLSVPLVFWLFGPHFMAIATMVSLPALYYLDRAPRPSVHS
jgi:uncharacterized membrane protein